MKPTKTTIFLAITVVLLLVLMMIQRTKMRNENTNLQSKLDYSTQSYTQEKNKNGRLVTEQKIAETTSKQQIKELSDKYFALEKSQANKVKSTSTFVTAKQEVRVEPIFIPYDTGGGYLSYDTLQNKPDGTWVATPQHFSTENENYSIGGTVKHNGVDIDSIIVPNDVSFRIAEVKRGWFKAAETVVQVVNSNPIVSTTGVNSITIKPKVSLWNRVLKPALVAIVVFLITTAK